MPHVSATIDYTPGETYCTVRFLDAAGHQISWKRCRLDEVGKALAAMGKVEA